MIASPTFTPTRVIGRRAKPFQLVGNGDTRQAVNLIPKEEVVDRIHDFSERVLSPLLHGADATFVPILNGAINFYATLSQMVAEGSHIELMPVAANRCGSGRAPGPVAVSPDLILPEKIRGRTLVVIDDVLDTGRTAAAVTRLLAPHGPARVITVYLLRKMHAKAPAVRPDYWLFEVHPESWVFGFGMDLAEKYRHLRFVCDDRLDLYDRDGRPKY